MRRAAVAVVGEALTNTARHAGPTRARVTLTVEPPGQGAGEPGTLHLAVVEDFDAIQAQNDNFRWTLALSEPLPEDRWEGPVGFIHQVLLDNYLSKHPAPEDNEYYICGPPMMNTAVINMLQDLGVEEENILFDDFGL